MSEIIRQIDAETQVTIRDWDCSIREIARELNLHQSNITNVISGKRKTVGGFIFQKISDISDINSDINSDISVTTSDITSVPVRKIPLTIKDIDKDDPSEIVRTNDNVSEISDREQKYVDWVWDCFQNLDEKQKLINPDTKRPYLLYSNRDYCESEICTHLEGGYHYKCEPAQTIKRACELVLFDLFLDDELKDFKSDFSTEVFNMK